MIEGENGQHRSSLGDDEQPLDAGMGGVYVVIPDDADSGSVV